MVEEVLQDSLSVLQRNLCIVVGTDYFLETAAAAAAAAALVK